MSSNEVKF